ncbi:hypothetical protein U1Q18_001968 [Sarracenia purpurea var. burkii]
MAFFYQGQLLSVGFEWYASGSALFLLSWESYSNFALIVACFFGFAAVLDLGRVLDRCVFVLMCCLGVWNGLELDLFWNGVCVGCEWSVVPIKDYYCNTLGFLC